MIKFLRVLTCLVILWVIVKALEGLSYQDQSVLRFWGQILITFVLQVLGVATLVAFGDTVAVPVQRRLSNWAVLGNLIPYTVTFAVISVAAAFFIPIDAFDQGMFDFSFYSVGAEGAGLLALFVVGVLFFSD